MDRALVILLHGVGSDGANMAAIGQALAPALPGVAFESPDAPQAMGGGWAWFSVAGITETNRPARVAAARADFDAVVAGLIARHGLSDALERVALLGFSQGSIMALDALATGRWPIGAVIAFSGRLASVSRLTPSTRTPLLLVHGDADRVMPSSETKLADEALRGAGVTTTVIVERGLGHQISSSGLAQAATFLKRVLG